MPVVGKPLVASAHLFENAIQVKVVGKPKPATAPGGMGSRRRRV
jgi:hypothetical protein